MSTGPKEGIITDVKEKSKNVYAIVVKIAGADTRNFEWPSNIVTFCAVLLPKRDCQGKS